MGSDKLNEWTIREWPTEGGICQELVDEGSGYPAYEREDECYYRVIDKSIYESLKWENEQLKKYIEELQRDLTRLNQNKRSGAV